MKKARNKQNPQSNKMTERTKVLNVDTFFTCVRFLAIIAMFLMSLKIAAVFLFRKAINHQPPKGSFSSFGVLAGSLDGCCCRGVLRW